MMDSLPAAPSPPGLQGPAADAPALVPTLTHAATNFPDPRSAQLAEALRRQARMPLPPAARSDARAALTAMQAARFDVPQQVVTHATVMRMALQLLPAAGRPRPRSESRRPAAAPSAARSVDELLGRTAATPPAPTHRTLLAAFARNGITPVGARASREPQPEHAELVA